MDIVFNINTLGIEGLGATLTSLIRNCSDNKKLTIYFLSSNLAINDKNNIKKLLKIENYEGETRFIEYDAQKMFGHLRSLHGDWTAYGRLLIPEYIQSDMALYLDSDLVVLLDVLNLSSIDFGDYFLAAVFGSPICNVLDQTFFLKKLGWSPDQAYFNSGVVVFNIRKWRELNIDDRWKFLAETFPNDLISHDQTLLNAVCKGKFKILPAYFNNQWIPGETTPLHVENSIIHFVGSPKPWDLLGKYIHKGYNTWRAYNSTFWEGEYNKINLEKIKRTWFIKKSIIRHLSNSFLKTINIPA